MRRLLIEGSGGLRTAAAWPSFHGGDLVLAPRSLYEVFPVEVPPVRGDRLDAALPWRVRALYPGSTEATVLDHRPIPGDAARRLVFVADRDGLADMRTEAAGLPLAAGALLLSSAPMRGLWTGILWTSRETEVVRLDGPSVLATQPGPEEDGTSGPERTASRASSLARALAQEPEDVPVVVAYTRDAESDKENIATAMAFALPGREPRILPLENVIPRPTADSCAVFATRKVPRILNARNIARFFAAAALLLAAAVPSRLAGIRESQLSGLKAEYEAAKDRSNAIMERAAEYDRLAARRAELEALHGPEAYRLIADIASGVGPGVRATNLTLEETSFRLDATGRDGLSVLKRMEDSGLFESVRLDQSASTSDGGERYTLSGRVKR